MALNIKSPECDRLARELADLTGEGLTEAVTKALTLRLERERQARDKSGRNIRKARLDELFDRMRSYPVLDDRPADEILGYNEHGTFE